MENASTLKILNIIVSSNDLNSKGFTFLLIPAIIPQTATWRWCWHSFDKKEIFSPFYYLLSVNSL